MTVRPHILYDNWMYYKVDNEELLTMIYTQDRILAYINFLDLTGEDVEFMFYKRECLLFELHRRSFSNCIIQMYAVCKVKCWLPHVDTNRRCNCCNLEYYEFLADLAKIKQGILKCPEMIRNLLQTKAFDGGRVLGRMRNGFFSDTSSSSSSSTDNDIPTINFPTRRFLYSKDEKTPIPAPRGSKAIVSYISISSDESYDEESQSPVELPDEDKQIAPASDLTSPKPDLIPPISLSEVLNEDAPKPSNTFFLSWSFPRTKKRQVTSKLTKNEGQSYAYQKLNEDQSDKLTNEKKSVQGKSCPAWSFASKLFK